MSDSVIKKGTAPTSWTQIQNANHAYRKSGNTVTIELAGSITLNSSGSIQNFSLPEGFRPSKAIHFFCANSGNQSNAPFLCAVNTDGTILVYTRGQSVTYLYGSCSFIVD